MIDIKPKSVLEQPIYMLTKATSCPYLTGKVEKRIATDISNNKSIYEELSINGFRRVENWMYRPVCDNCSACKSYRVDIQKFKITKSLKRVSKNFDNFSHKLVNNVSTKEHYELFKKYQLNRHAGGSMSDMDEDEFTSMIETSPIKTSLLEFRDKSRNLVGVVLLDIEYTLTYCLSFVILHLCSIIGGACNLGQCTLIFLSLFDLLFPCSLLLLLSCASCTSTLSAFALFV